MGLSARQVRELILQKHQLKSTRKTAKHPRSASPTSIIGKKNYHMRLLEQQFGKPIEDLLTLNLRQQEIADLLGVHFTTVSHWKRRLGLRGPRISGS